MPKAIVTLIIGKYYQERWYKLCAENWRRYAEVHGYDIVCIDTPLDNSPRAQSRCPAWQKCLILGDERVKKYDRIVWIDSDILINPNSPCVVAGVPDQKIGAVEMFTGPLGESFPGEKQLLVDRAIEVWKWPFRNGREFYFNSGLPDNLDLVVQTGVMVLSPRHHHFILEHTYHSYEEVRNGHFEMESLSYELVKAGYVHWIDYRFNRLWFECMLRDYPFLLPRKTLDNTVVRAWKRFTRGNSKLPPKAITTRCLNSSFINNYFLHFAGTSQYMSWVNTSIYKWDMLRSKV